MAATCRHSCSILSLINRNSIWCKDGFRIYSQFSPKLLPPVYQKEEIENLLKEEKKEALAIIPRRPPLNQASVSVFHDEDKTKFILLLMKQGKKEKARQIVNSALTEIKHSQLRKYNKEKDEEKRKEIVIDPLEILHMAIRNVTPSLYVKKIKRSGTWYRVPTGISPTFSKFIGMRWIIQCAIVKHEKMPHVANLVTEILNASQYEGKAVQKKIELLKLCEANRAYAHYTWT